MTFLYKNSKIKFVLILTNINRFTISATRLFNSIFKIQIDKITVVLSFSLELRSRIDMVNYGQIGLGMVMVTSDNSEVLF